MHLVNVPDDFSLKKKDIYFLFKETIIPILKQALIEKKVDRSIGRPIMIAKKS